MESNRRSDDLSIRKNLERLRTLWLDDLTNHSGKNTNAREVTPIIARLSPLVIEPSSTITRPFSPDFAARISVQQDIQISDVRPVPTPDSSHNSLQSLSSFKLDLN